MTAHSKEKGTPTIGQLLWYLGITFLFIVFTWFFSLLFSLGFTMLDQKYDFLGIFTERYTRPQPITLDKVQLLESFNAVNTPNALSDAEKNEIVLALEKMSGPSPLSEKEKMDLLKKLEQ